MKHIFYGIVLFLFVGQASLFSQQSLSQQAPIDSVPIGEAFVLYKKAFSLFPTDINRSIYYNKEALTLVNPEANPLLNAKINHLMGDLFSKNNNLQPAINYYLICAKIYKRLHKPVETCHVYQQLGELYYRDNYNLENALNYFNKALEIAATLNNNALIAEMYNQIGGIFFNQNNFIEASSYFEKALHLWKITGNQEGIARCFNNMGEIFRVKNQMDKANEYYLKSLKINTAIDNVFNKAVNYENLGLVKSAKGDHQSAFHYFSKSMKLYTEANDVESKMNVMLLIANEYVAEKKYKAAFKMFNASFLKAQKQHHWELLIKSAKGLSEVFEKTGHLDQSLYYYKVYAQYIDSVNLKKQKEQLIDLQTHFLNDIKEKELSIKDKEIALLQSDKKLHNLQNYFLFAGFIVLIIISFLLISWYKTQFKKERLLSIKNEELHRAQKELMELEIKSKDNDLTNFALHVVEKNSFLWDLRKQLKALNNYPENEKSRKINELIVTVQQNLQIQQELEQFKYKVEQTYQGFFKRLKQKLPTITKNEERLCALLRLNLSSKEIAALNNTSIKAVEMSRYRLRKKCCINNNDNLCDYLEKI